MSYTEEISRSLIDTLTRTAGLPTFQLAGHVPNLPFWMDEIRHALTVIAGYLARHEAMIRAQNEFDAQHPDNAQARQRHEYHYREGVVAVPPAVAERLSRELKTVANRLIDRCLKEELINIELADDLREKASGDSPAHGL